VPFILAHTAPGDLVLDTFAGTGSTGIAAALCAVVPSRADNEQPVISGPRRAFLTDIGVLPHLIGSVTLDPPDPQEFEQAAREILGALRTRCGRMYAVIDPNGTVGELRHAVWTEHLFCPRCQLEMRFWESAVSVHPPAIRDRILCQCGHNFRSAAAKRVIEDYFDPLTQEWRQRRVRSLAWVCGVSGSTTWQRPVETSDIDVLSDISDDALRAIVPKVEVINPGAMELYRSGYHFGLKYLHDFYTRRNLATIASAWQLVSADQSSLGRSLRLWLSSYNATHSTIMTRIVAKKSAKELVVTGAQPAALYVSSIPVEKNILRGLERKLNSFVKSFTALRQSGPSKSTYVLASATQLPLPNHSVDYVFIDPPFGDNIQYSEVNRLAEAWLGKFTDSSTEIIVSRGTGKSVERYGDLMEAAFRELHRVLKPSAYLTLVFHSSQMDVWHAVEAAWRSAGFDLSATSTLSKSQGSFKQVTTRNAVSQDLVILLERRPQGASEQLMLPSEPRVEVRESINRLVTNLPLSGPGVELRSKQHLYSQTVSAALIAGVPLAIGAAEFYDLLVTYFDEKQGLYYIREQSRDAGTVGDVVPTEPVGQKR
jgi:16S rRNA G966 N2-methylase RsmD